MPPAAATATLDPTTRELIRRKAHQVVRRGGFSPSDLADVEQDLTLHVWDRLGRFDPARAEREVFVRMLVGHAAATALRGRRRRSRPAELPLAAAVAGGDAEPVDPRSWPGPRDARVRVLDVGAVLAALPADLRRVARALSTRSIAAAARHLGISRAALYRRLGHLRAAFLAAGFEGLAAAARRTRRPRAG